MNHLPLIKASYDWFYAHYEREVASLDPSKDGHAVDQLEKKRDIFERGIFVLMFAQFEKEVDRVFQAALAKRGGAEEWNDRRGWDLDHLRGERVSFYVRLAMVLDKQNHNFSKIWDAYRIRNDCAHGETETPIGSISLLEQSLYRWRAMLRD